MLSLLKKLFGGSQTQKNFQFLIVKRGEEIPKNRWYRMDHWESAHFLRMNTEWDKDWKCISDEEPIVGVTYEDRQRKFLVMGEMPDFRVFLQRDPANPYDKNAIKVMASATVGGATHVKQIGFVSKETALSLKDEPDLDARPYSVYLPYGDCKFGLRIRILVRSSAYKKRRGAGAKVHRR